jgi:hypothetical protein
MALQKDFVLSAYGQDVTIKDAYLKVINVNGNKNNLKIVVGIFDQKDGSLVEKMDAVFVPNLEDNFIKQAYRHLKTLPEFAGATDC